MTGDVSGDAGSDESVRTRARLREALLVKCFYRLREDWSTKEQSECNLNQQLVRIVSESYFKDLTQLHIWKLRSCAARHEKRAKALKKRLLSEIRSLNLEIREQEYRQQICARLASKKSFKLEQTKAIGKSNWAIDESWKIALGIKKKLEQEKVTPVPSGRPLGAYTLEERRKYGHPREFLGPAIPRTRVPFDHSVTHPCSTPFEL